VGTVFPVDIYLAMYLVLIGFVVGILSGFFGFGGGFIITPFLFILGVPPNVAVGTSIAQILGTSVIATLRHRNLGHIDSKLGTIIAIGSLIGVEVGAQLVEYFKRIGIQALDMSISLTYILVLGSISIFMSYEAWKSRREDSASSQKRFAQKVYCLRIPPMISLPQSNIAQISLWIVLFIGFITGVLAGFMGAGGGFVQMPLLIYAIGCETVVAVGTSLLGILISGVSASFSHAMKGNVDIILAVIMLAGSSVGSRIGVSATKYIKGRDLRLIFGNCVGLISLSVAFKLTAWLSQAVVLGFLSQALLVSTIVSLAIFVMISTFLGIKRKSVQ